VVVFDSTGRDCVPPAQEAMTVTIGDITFDRVHYDAEGDVLYQHVGDPSAAVDFDETPEGHAVRFDSNGNVVGLTLVRPKWVLVGDEVFGGRPKADEELEQLEPLLRVRPARVIEPELLELGGRHAASRSVRIMRVPRRGASTIARRVADSARPDAGRSRARLRIVFSTTFISNVAKLAPTQRRTPPPKGSQP
jgi:uncharacterized protein YuzE